MPKSAPPRDKYFLRSLHEEIDFYDRKLADLEKYDHFSTPKEREDAKDKLISKRATLEKTARELAASGVEFNEAELPRSFRPVAADASVRAGQAA